MYIRNCCKNLFFCLNSLKFVKFKVIDLFDLCFWKNLYNYWLENLNINVWWVENYVKLMDLMF